MIPARGILLVRPIESAEKLAGARIILTADTRERMTAHQFEVVAVGAFALCDPKRSKAERTCERPHAVYTSGCACDIRSPMPCSCIRRVHPHTLCVGDWILVAPRTTIGGPDPERPECFVHQDNVWGIFNSDTTND